MVRYIISLDLSRPASPRPKSQNHRVRANTALARDLQGGWGPIRARLGLDNKASHFKPLVPTLTKVDLWSIK